MNRIVESDIIFTTWSAYTVNTYQRMISTNYDFKKYFSDCTIKAMQTIFNNNNSTKENSNPLTPLIKANTTSAIKSASNSQNRVFTLIRLIN